MIGHGEREIGAADLAAGGGETVEGLRAGHFMDEVAVDIEQRGAVVALLDDMRVEDLLVERAGGGECWP